VCPLTYLPISVDHIFFCGIFSPLLRFQSADHTCYMSLLPLQDATWVSLDKYIKTKVDEESRKKLKTTAQKRKYVENATRLNLRQWFVWTWNYWGVWFRDSNWLANFTSTNWCLTPDWSLCFDLAWIWISETMIQGAEVGDSAGMARGTKQTTHWTI